MFRILAHSVIELLILRRLHLKVLGVASVLLNFPPLLNLVLGLSKNQHSTYKPGKNDEDAAFDSLIHLSLVCQKIESPKANDHRGSQET